MPFTFKLSKRLALMKASLVPAAAAALAACQLQDRRGITDPTLPSSAVMQVVTSPDIAPPIASWKLDEGAGSTAADASGNGNTATLGGGSSWTPGLVGSAVLLDGVSGQLSVPSSPSLNLAGAFSVDPWGTPQNAMHYLLSFAVFYYTYFLYAS